jgi:DNA-binding HxlR family transcriptional regulator
MIPGGADLNYAGIAAEAADTIGKKWVVNIVVELANGPRRYNDLLRRLDHPVAPKVFTRALRRLEAENIIQRVVIDGSPPGVEYRLTNVGQSLLATISDLAGLWASRRQNGDLAVELT